MARDTNPMRAILDTRRVIETPEGVELTLRVAGPLPRASAWLVDALVKFGILLACSTVLPFLGNYGMGLVLFAMFALLWLYTVLFEVYGKGATPGKRVMRLRVVHRNGTPVGWTGAVIRNLVRAADSLPVGYGVGLVTMMLNRDFQRLGDLAADTVVVHDAAVPGRPATPDVRPTPLKTPLTPQDQHAILLFSERAPNLSKARRIELADILAGKVTSGGEAGVRELNAHANWVAGRQ